MLVYPEGTRRLPGGRSYRLGGILGRIMGLPCPKRIFLLQGRAFLLHPRVGGLLSGDGVPLEADFLVEVQVSDPVLLVQSFPAEGGFIRPVAVEVQAGEEVAPWFRAQVKSYAADDLCGRRDVAERLAGELRGFLAAWLEPRGLQVKTVRFLSFRLAEDAARLAEAYLNIRQRLRAVSFAERLDEKRAEMAFWDEVKGMEHEYHLSDLMRQEELEAWRDEWIAEAKMAAPEERITLSPAEERAGARIEALLGRLGYKEAEEGEDEAIERLRRWIAILRAAASIIIALTMLLHLLAPDLFKDPKVPRIINLLAGIVLAVTALLSALWLGGRVKRRRDEARRARRWKRLGPERRQALDKIVRERVSVALERVERNLSEAWHRAYRLGMTEVAVELRRLSRRAGELRESLRYVSLADAPLLRERKVSPEALEALLSLDEGWLAQARALAERSQRLFADGVEGRWEAVEGAARRIEIGLQRVQDAYAERRRVLRFA